MSLTLADVRRLERAGHRDFYELGDDGALRLRNADGRCLFLTGSRCEAYPDRPDGCVLYPMIWLTADGEPGEAGLHEFCPHHTSSVSASDRGGSRNIVAESRRAARRAGLPARGLRHLLAAKDITDG
jgi:Fe-S-cluster containining protein